MAHLGGKKTDGRPAWEFYIQDNPMWKSLELVVENGVTAPVYSSTGKTVKDTLKPGTPLKLTTNRAKVISGKKYAQTTKGLVYINHVRKPTKIDTVKDEKIAMDKLQNLLDKLGRPITIHVCNNKGNVIDIGKDITTVGEINGTPKADFSLKNKNGKDIIFISHKKAGGARAFQQYSGVSKASGEEIYNHPEVQKFLKNLTGMIENNKLTNPAYMIVKDKKLINLSVFGPEFNKKFSKEHCQVIGQGDPILEPIKGKDDEFYLKWSDHSALSGEAHEFMKGDYTAILGATYRAGRKFTYKGKSYVGARVGIYPVGFISARKGSIEIEN